MRCDVDDNRSKKTERCSYRNKCDWICTINFKRTVAHTPPSDL